jgi:putative aldouronate transport system permease protein
MQYRQQKILKDIARDRYLYLLLLPGLIYFIVFKYFPMYGLIISFKDFSIFKGIWASEWVGFAQFEKLFYYRNFWAILRNTALISGMKILFGFPVPIILAVLMNEIINLKFKKITQTMLYLPHFISWVVLGGIIFIFLNPSYGLVNELVKAFGGQPVDFLLQPRYFRGLIVLTDIYKDAGWGTVVFMAAISGINPELYDASYIDGANRFQRMRYITIPSIKSVIIIMFILRIGYILEAGFFQIFVLYSPAVYEVGDIIDTYVYRQGIKNANYSLAAAAGLFKSLIALILVILTNKTAKLFKEASLW